MMPLEKPITDNILEFDKSDSHQLVAELKEMKQEVVELSRFIEGIARIQAPLIGIEGVAEYFGKSQDTIRRWVKDRVLSCYKLPVKNGYTYLFSMKQIEEDLEDYLVSRY